MGCGGSTQARSPTARQRFRDPTPQTQAPLGAYPSAPPQPMYSQAGYNQQQMGYNPQQTGYNPQQTGYNPQQMGYNPQQQGYYQNARPMAPGGDPVYPPPAYPTQAPMPPPPAYGVQPTAPPAYPVQHGNPHTTVIVQDRRRRHSSGDEAMAIVGGLAMGAMVGAALHGSFSSLSSGFSF